MASIQFKIFDQFYPQAKKLRLIYDQRFADPHIARAGRFVWDFWHVPREYTLLRTPAVHFFPPRDYTQFHRYLVEWGRANLGCHDVSPPWLSCYIEGCRQETHQDVPHGPLAFVFSLTMGKRFAGGETFLKLPASLTAGARNGPRASRNVAPRFNRLLVFDPAIPHGVNKVSGTFDPRYARLVVHGWFVNPRPFWYGALDARQVQSTLDRDLPEVFERAQLHDAQGFASFRLHISPGGTVKRVEPLISTVAASSTTSRSVHCLVSGLSQLRFPRRRSQTRLTLPLLFAR